MTIIFISPHAATTVDYRNAKNVIYQNKYQSSLADYMESSSRAATCPKSKSHTKN